MQDSDILRDATDNLLQLMPLIDGSNGLRIARSFEEQLDTRQQAHQQQQQQQQHQQQQQQQQQGEGDVPVFVRAVVEGATRKVSKDQVEKFSEPAFRCVSDYERCVKNRSDSRLCLAALLISLGRLLIPFIKVV
jgi:hypothetical protein